MSVFEVMLWRGFRSNRQVLLINVSSSEVVLN